MITAEREQKYIAVLKEELIPAMGCTEPIAIAYAAAKAREVLGAMPERMDVCCSGNIIKNVKGVTVPNSGGLRGMDAAAVLGAVGGDASRELEVLKGVTAEDIAKTKHLLKTGFVDCSLQEEVANLYIKISMWTGEHSASVTIVNRHTEICEIVKDGETLFRLDTEEEAENNTDWDIWSVESILEYVETGDVSKVKDILSRQVELNTAISNEGLRNSYGAEVGRTLLAINGEKVWVRAKAKAAAGSDARMGGCPLPVVINSGSGNQGITVSLPVVEYAQELGQSEEKMYRALLLSNLISVYIKHFIGKLSAFCGAVTAACGSGAAITWLHGGDYHAICSTIVNTLGNVGGIVCDGAKASCAAKIASAVDAAIMGHEMTMRSCSFQPGEGVVQEDIEKTIRSIGYMGRVGMKTTDVEILNLMLDKIAL